MTPQEEAALRLQYQPYLDPPRDQSEIGRAKHFALLRILGKGGMGCAFLAVDELTCQRIVIKVPLPGVLHQTDEVLRFHREQKASKELGRHEHIVMFHDAGVFQISGANGLPYIATEYVPGRTLRQKLQTWTTLPIVEVVRILMETCLGLQFLHDKEHCHRDLKPSNLILDALHAEQVRIADFGLAINPDNQNEDLSQGPVGTPGYTAPERIRDYRTYATSPVADIFSVGCIAYEMLTGQRAFSGTSIAFSTAPTPLLSLRPDTPPKLAAVVEDMLQTDPKRRMQSAGEAKRRLDDLVDLIATTKTTLASNWPTASPQVHDRLRSLAAVTFDISENWGRERNGILLGLARRKQLSRELYDSMYRVANQLLTLQFELHKKDWNQVRKGTQDVLRHFKRLPEQLIRADGEADGFDQFRANIRSARAVTDEIIKSLEGWVAESPVGRQPLARMIAKTMKFITRRNVPMLRRFWARQTLTEQEWLTFSSQLRAHLVGLIDIEAAFVADQWLAVDRLLCEIERIERA